MPSAGDGALLQTSPMAAGRRRLAAQKDHDAADAVADQLTSGIIASWDVEPLRDGIAPRRERRAARGRCRKAKHLDMEEG